MTKSEMQTATVYVRRGSAHRQVRISLGDEGLAAEPWGLLAIIEDVYDEGSVVRRQLVAAIFETAVTREDRTVDSWTTSLTDPIVALSTLSRSVQVDS